MCYVIILNVLRQFSFIVTKFQDTEDEITLLKIIKKWIDTFIFVLETEYEYRYSYKSLLSWIEEKEFQSKMDEGLRQRVKQFLICLDMDEAYWAYYNKVGKEFYGVVTTSMSEGLHYRIKNGAYAVKPTMTLGTSMSTLVKKSNEVNKKVSDKEGHV